MADRWGIFKDVVVRSVVMAAFSRMLRCYGQRVLGSAVARARGPFHGVVVRDRCGGGVFKDVGVRDRCGRSIFSDVGVATIVVSAFSVMLWWRCGGNWFPSVLDANGSTPTKTGGLGCPNKEVGVDRGIVLRYEIDSRGYVWRARVQV